LRIKEEKEKRI